jgi:flagellar protein FliS
VNGYARAQSAYTESSVLTAPPERLVLMLYDGAIRFLRQGSIALEQGEPTYARDRIRRAEAIVDELNVTLDMKQGGEIASRLRSIYLFCKRHLNKAILENDRKAVDEVVGLLSGLRESWDKLAQTAATAA